MYPPTTSMSQAVIMVVGSIDGEPSRAPLDPVHLRVVCIDTSCRDSIRYRAVGIEDATATTELERMQRFVSRTEAELSSRRPLSLSTANCWIQNSRPEGSGPHARPRATCCAILILFAVLCSGMWNDRVGV